MPSSLMIDGTKYELFMKGGGPASEKKIKDWIYDHALGRKTKVFDPNGAGFHYLYVEVPS